MTPSQEQMTEQTPEDVADNIAALVIHAPEDEALDRLSGLLMDGGAALNLPVYYLCFERFMAAGKMLEAVTCWRHFTVFLKDNAETLKDAAESYAAAVNVLGSFIAAFDRSLDDFSAFHIFSDEVRRALDHFDTVTMKSPTHMMPSDMPPAAVVLDTLSLGDRCLMDGDDMLAAAFFRRAAVEENNPEGWFRLLQLMSEADLGTESTPEKVKEAKEAAIAAGFWHARAYYILRLLSAPEDTAADLPLDDATKKELQAETAAFVEDFKAFVKPAQSGFSKYATPPVFQKATHIYDQDKAEDVIKRLRAVTESNAMKVAIGTFAQTALFMLAQGFIQKDAHLPDLAGALETALYALADESADIADMLARDVPENTPFWEDQQHFGQVALSINGDIGPQLGELAQMLSE